MAFFFFPCNLACLYTNNKQNFSMPLLMKKIKEQLNGCMFGVAWI